MKLSLSLAVYTVHHLRKRHLAPAFLGWRAAMTDEQWIDWNAQDDKTWYEQVQRDFGLDARPESLAAGSAGQ